MSQLPTNTLLLSHTASLHRTRTVTSSSSSNTTPRPQSIEDRTNASTAESAAYASLTVEHKRNARKNDNESEDVLGKHILKLLQRSDYCNHKKRHAVSTTNQQFQTPLLCRHNFQVLRHKLMNFNFWIYFRSMQQQQHRHCGRIHEHQHQFRPSCKECTVAAIQLCLALVLAIAVLAYILILYAVGCCYATILYLVSGVLIDIETIQTNIPFIFYSFYRFFQTIYYFMDDILLQGNRFVGRESDHDDFVWDTLSVQNETRYDSKYVEATPVGIQHHILLLPPPKPNTHNIVKPTIKVWSETQQHVTAIEYCCTMMKKEQLRQQEKKKRRRTTNSDDSRAKKDKIGFHNGISKDNPTQNQEDNSGECIVAELKHGERLKIWSKPSLSVERNTSHDRATPREAIELQVESSPEKCVRIEPLMNELNETLSDEEDDRNPMNSNLSDLTGVADMPWIDVGAQIGMRLLNSEHIQRAVASQETKDRILETMGTLDTSMYRVPAESRDHSTTTDKTFLEQRLTRPVHSIWTFPTVAVDVPMNTNSIIEEVNDNDMDEPYTDIYAINMSQSFPTSPASRWNIQYSKMAIGSHDPKNRNRNNAADDQLMIHSISKLPLSTDFSAPSLSPSSQMPSFQNLFQSESNDTSQNSQPKSMKSIPSHLPTRWKPTVSRTMYRREPLATGIKIAVPIFPIQPTGGFNRYPPKHTTYQMATVISSKRIYVADHDEPSLRNRPNCLSVTVKLEKSFLRNGEFAEMNFRVMDTWGTRYMPRHSKVPIGSCVATSFGTGVLVGWRVEDDCHVIRSLWQLRGPGSAHAYLKRSAIHSTIEASVGFRVQTMYGWGIVLACTNGGTTFETCRFFVVIQEECRHKGRVLELHRKEILSCHGAQFMPVIEHIREAAHYQIRLDEYNAALREQSLVAVASKTEEQDFVQAWTACASILWDSFLKAVEEDKDFDDGVNDFMEPIITFLERLDQDSAETDEISVNTSPQKRCDGSNPIDVVDDNEIEVRLASDCNSSCYNGKKHEPGFWIMNDLLGGLVRTESKKDSNQNENDEETKEADTNDLKTDFPSYYRRAFAALRTLMKTVSIARAASFDHPHFRLSLAITYDFLLFIRTIVKIQQKNTSEESLKVWRAAWEEIVSTFGPIQERLESIGRGIAQRMEQQGRKAKIRVLRFADTLLNDDRLLFALEQGEWDRCLGRIEVALVEAEVIEEENLVYYRKAAQFVYNHIKMAMESDGGASTRNNEKLVVLAHAVQLCATPRRSILKLFCRDDMLELLERILVRSYYKEEEATRMLTIHAANFHSLRHLRMLKDFSVAGKIWIPLLNAADEEFSWLVSSMPENSKSIMCPLSSLFSLCVAQFHKICAGDLSKDWLDFLLEDESIRIIHDIDMILTLALQSFSLDVHEMITVLPYYPSIEDDILNLMDEVNLDEFLREMSDAIDDPEKLSLYIREKTTIAVERFLNYLPKMSIPVERRDLGEGWVLTCHGEDGGGLTLSDVNIKRENLVCQVMGGDTLFFPTFASDSSCSDGDFPGQLDDIASKEDSIMDHIRVLIVNARKYGCWEAGVGGVGQPLTDSYAASVLRGLPVTHVLNCAIELWRNLDIDDDELLEIAIRDISYHIELAEQQKAGPHHVNEVSDTPPIVDIFTSTSFFSVPVSSSSSEDERRRFNPRVDPTVLFLEIKNLTLNLDNFFFRIEKGERKTVFDPIFEGRGMLMLQNITIRLSVECAKERVHKSANPGLSVDISTPILQIRDVDVKLEKLQMTVRDTGFGSDWVLNKAVEVFEEKLTEVVENNLKEQILEQVQNAIKNINSYFLMNPDLFLNLLGISMDDLDEHVLWV